MQMPPTAFGSTLPMNNTFNLPGVGNVQMSYTPAYGTSGNYTALRSQIAPFTSGSVNHTGDTFSWTDLEFLTRTHNTPPGAAVPWSVTYTFTDGPVTAGTLALGVMGLGRLDLVYPGYITTASVTNNGTYLGEYGVSPSYGSNQFTGFSGSFSLQNALPGDLTPGSPAFNSALAVVRLEDSISSLTVNFSQIGGDGTGLDIGFITLVPEPSAVALTAIGLAGLLGLRAARQKGAASAAGPAPGAS